MTVARIASFRSEDHEERIRDGEREEPCWICGRGVDMTRPHMMIQVGGGGGLFISADEEITEQDWVEGYMGCFPIGRTCLRKHPELRPYVSEFGPRTDPQPPCATGFEPPSVGS